MFVDLDSKRDTTIIRQNLLESLIIDSQQPNQPLLNQLLEYFFQTESSNALHLIKQFNESGKQQTKVLIEHLNAQGLKQCVRYGSGAINSESQMHDENEKVAHTMKVFRVLCLIIHSQVPGLSTVIKDTVLLSSCVHAITKCKDDPNILAQACYFFAALTTVLPGEIVQYTEQILNIFKTTCKYLFKYRTSLRQLAIQTDSHSLDNVQLWIVNQSVHALFYALYTVYPCNFAYQIFREYRQNENADLFEEIVIPIFQYVRFNPRLIDNDRKREMEKEKRIKSECYDSIYDARKLTLDPLFGRELPANSNWMHLEMKRILPFYQFKRQSPTRSIDQISDGRRSLTDVSSPVEITSRRSNTSPFQKLKDKFKSLVRPSTSSTPSSPDGVTAPNNNMNMTSVSYVSSSVVPSPSPALSSDIRAVKTMPELQHNSEVASSSPVTLRSDQQHQTYVKHVIETLSSIYEQNLPSHLAKFLGHYDPNLLTVQTPQRQATFYVSPSDHSLYNQQQQQQQKYDDASPSSTGDKRERCASASCATQHTHSPVLAAPATSIDDILPRTQSLSTKQRVRRSLLMPTTAPFQHSGKYLPSNQIQYEENDHDDDDENDDVLIDLKPTIDPWSTDLPPELLINSDVKSGIIDEIPWNDHDFISVPHFDFNEIVTKNCSSIELKRFERLYECHSNYETFLTEQYKKKWESLIGKQKSYQKNQNELQATLGFMDTLRSEVQGHLREELEIYKRHSQNISDENTLLGEQIVEHKKVTSRRKQSLANDETQKEMLELEEACKQDRKMVNNDTLKLNNHYALLDDNDKQAKLTENRLEQLRIVTQNLAYLDGLNQELECQHLHLIDDHLLLPSSSVVVGGGGDDNEQQHLLKARLSVSTINGHEENSEFDAMSFSDEQYRDGLEDNDEQIENFDQLFAETLELLTNQNTNNQSTPIEIENEAYNRVLDYMERKAQMQKYLLEHNTHYIELYRTVQQDYIEQLDKELVSTDSALKQMQTNVAI